METGVFRGPSRSAVQSLTRPQLNSTTLTLLVTLALVLFYNGPLWATVLQARIGGARGPAFLVALFLLIAVALHSLLSLLAFKYVQKTTTILILLTAAIATHFTSRYGVLIDMAMMQSLFDTDVREARELLDGRLLFHFFGLGVVPSIVVYRTRIRYLSLTRELAVKAAVLAAGALLAGLVLAGFYRDLAILSRDHRELRHLVTPVNYIYASLRCMTNAVPLVVQPLGRDAVLGARVRNQAKPTVAVLVIGETARTQNFSLNGYARQTNPVLAEERVVSFENVDSCGTSTAVSLPCLFSDLGRARFTIAEARRHEGLLDVLAHAHLRVLWLDNNSGCKGVCDRVESARATVEPGQPSDSGAPFDEALLDRLEAEIETVDTSTVIVLHQKGSHGPAYWRRYPERFRVFTPECRDDQLEGCDRQEIVNAYDNTILYTDFFLGRVISILRSHSDRVASAMLYTSDHGESLGERNVYLHGLPYLIAPEEQTRVPLIFWMSDGYGQAHGLDADCLARRRGMALSHDHVFHSVLALLDVQTAVRDEQMDLFAGCWTVEGADLNPPAVAPSMDAG